MQIYSTFHLSMRRINIQKLFLVALIAKVFFFGYLLSSDTFQSSLECFFIIIFTFLKMRLKICKFEEVTKKIITRVMRQQPPRVNFEPVSKEKEPQIKSLFNPPKMAFNVDLLQRNVWLR